MLRRTSLRRTASSLVAVVIVISGGRTIAGQQSGSPVTRDHHQTVGSQACVTPLSDPEAWRCLPTAEKGANQPLPVWARVLARSLPRTTAAMLELDRLHRACSPLGPLLSGKLRWAAANANRCAYGQATAAADLRRAGLDQAGMRALSGDHHELPAPEATALAFARKLTLTADRVTDEEVARLMAEFGPAKVTAMVLLLAYANFQDRLLLALDLPVEPGGPLAPLDVRFAKSAAAPPVPSRAKPTLKNLPPVPERVDDPEWLSLDVDQLQKGLSGQKGNAGRIRVPTWDEVRKVLPAGYPPPKKPLRIRWSLVCLGYQPALAAGWSACTRAFGEEANQDRVFEESLFWVVTRQIHCFY
jgi:alkylhydroperoxidase family enzyme